MAGRRGLRVVLQGDLDGTLGTVLDKLVAEDVALIEEDFGDFLLHVGRGNLHHFVASHLAVADARQEIGDRI